MEKPLISVILPIYNGKRYVRESIKSVVDQTYPNWELIVHDSASTDGTLSVLEEVWKEFPILQTRGKILKEAKKVNVPTALNIAFSHAKGDLFAWTSDDNRYLPEALEKLQGALEHNPDCSLTYASSYKIDSEGKRYDTLWSRSPEHLVYGNNIGLCFLFKKDVFDRIGGYDVNRFLVEDYDFWMRASEFFKFVRIDGVHYEIRYHSESLTDNNYHKMCFLSEDVFEADLPRMERWLPRVWQIRGHLRLMRTGLVQKKWKRFFYHAFQAFKKSPLLLVWESLLKLSRGLKKKFFPPINSFYAQG